MAGPKTEFGFITGRGTITRMETIDHRSRWVGDQTFPKDFGDWLDIATSVSHSGSYRVDA